MIAGSYGEVLDSYQGLLDQNDSGTQCISLPKNKRKPGWFASLSLSTISSKGVNILFPDTNFQEVF